MSSSRTEHAQAGQLGNGTHGNPRIPLIDADVLIGEGPSGEAAQCFCNQLHHRGYALLRLPDDDAQHVHAVRNAARRFFSESGANKLLACRVPFQHRCRLTALPRTPRTSLGTLHPFSSASSARKHADV
eukprot:1142466-Pleurochrysis_carterae.AAC.1